MPGIGYGKQIGLGEGLGAFGKGFISSYLGKKQLELERERGARQEEAADFRKKMWEDQVRTEAMQRKMAETEAEEIRDKQEIAIEHMRDELKEMTGKEIPEGADFKWYLNYWLGEKGVRAKGTTTTTPTSLWMTDEKARADIRRARDTYIDIYGDKHTVYPPYIIDLAEEWGISTEGMVTAQFYKDRDAKILEGAEEKEKGFWGGAVEKIGEKGAEIIQTIRKKQEQKAEKTRIIKELREGGATPEEIKQVLKEKFG